MAICHVLRYLRWQKGEWRDKCKRGNDCNKNHVVECSGPIAALVLILCWRVSNNNKQNIWWWWTFTPCSGKPGGTSPASPHWELLRPTATNGSKTTRTLQAHVDILHAQHLPPFWNTINLFPVLSSTPKVWPTRIASGKDQGLTGVWHHHVFRNKHLRTPSIISIMADSGGIIKSEAYFLLLKIF